MPICRLENTIQPYAWGSNTAIAELTGRPAPTARPEAELWMGTHPKGSSTALCDGGPVALADWISRDPVGTLGKTVAERFDNQLPFLFKVLAAASPLSVQAHPSQVQAREGFARENERGKPLDAPDRNYRDANHKPEIICALTPFWGLNGFRPVQEAIPLLEPVWPPELQDLLTELNNAGEGGIKRFFMALMGMRGQQRKAAFDQICRKAAALADDTPVYDWIVRLAAVYADDMGILAPALLNLVCLAPGQAMYLPAGQMHAYLDGTGIELMANSDNVLRGGLTPKHVDLDELGRVVDFKPSALAILEPQPDRPGEWIYDCPAQEFQLSRIQVDGVRPFQAAAARGVEILLCTDGRGEIAQNDQRLPVQRGESLLVPADLPAYTLTGGLTLYRAGVPL